jgi:acyl-CoA thioester hydrolase
MGVVYHANYLRWFEIGRTDLLRSLGHQYRDWEARDGVFLPVLSATMEFGRPARYDDWLAVETVLTHLTAATVEFRYRVVRVTGQAPLERLTSESAAEGLATGTTRHAFVDREGRIKRVATKLLPEVFASYRSAPTS